MCSGISWGEFIQFIIVVLFFYYLGTLFIYYRKDILKWIMQKTKANGSGKLVNTQPVLQPIPNVHQAKHANETKEAKIYTAVHELTHDVKIICSDAAYRKADKTDLIRAIQNKLSDYPILKGADLENEITQFIAAEAKQLCFIDLNKYDLEMLWKG